MSRKYRSLKEANTASKLFKTLSNRIEEIERKDLKDNRRSNIISVNDINRMTTVEVASISKNNVFGCISEGTIYCDSAGSLLTGTVIGAGEGDFFITGNETLFYKELVSGDVISITNSLLTTTNYTIDYVISDTKAKLTTPIITGFSDSRSAKILSTTALDEVYADYLVFSTGTLTDISEGSYIYTNDNTLLTGSSILDIFIIEDSYSLLQGVDNDGVLRDLYRTARRKFRVTDDATVDYSTTFTTDIKSYAKILQKSKYDDDVIYLSNKIKVTIGSTGFLDIYGNFT